MVLVLVKLVLLGIEVMLVMLVMLVMMLPVLPPRRGREEGRELDTKCHQKEEK